MPSHFRPPWEALASPAFLILPFLLPAVATPAAAQLVTDRPDFVESAAVVEGGVLQLETSAAWEETGSVDLWSTPTLVRLGLSRGWELRLETPGVLRAGGLAGTGDETGVADLAVGLKWHVSDEEGGMPAMAVLLHADLPTGSEPFKGDGVRPSVRVVGEWTLSPLLATGIMTGLRYDQTDDRRFTTGILAGVLGQNWTDRFRTYTEIAFSQLASERNGGDVGTVNLGAAVLASPAVQLDLGLGFGITDAAPDVLVTVGFSTRFGSR